MQQLGTDIGFEEQAIRLGCDNQSAIFLENNPTYHSKTKHIDVQYHFFREMIQEDKVEVVKNVANLLTKSISP